MLQKQEKRELKQANILNLWGGDHKFNKIPSKTRKKTNYDTEKFY